VLLEHFAEVITPGGAGVVIASMAGHLLPPLTAEQRNAIASTHPDDLLALPFLNPDVVTDPGWAYAIAKQAAIVRVGAAALAWGRRNARINSISPGTIATPMGYEELASPHGDGIRAMVTSSPLKRMGTPDEIAAASAFLLGSDAAFITGTDLLVDGGVTASVQTNFTQGVGR
jgi:NAD(P)-dependent dehydrogenase (short-subunit alcohol dehydrogenase family)